MGCYTCKSENILLLKEGDFTTGYFCNDCGFGRVDYNKDCCGNVNLTDIRFEQANGVWVRREACKNCKSLVGGTKKKGDGFDNLPFLTQAAYLEYQSGKENSYEKLKAYIQDLSNQWRIDNHNQWWENYSAYLKTDQWKHKRQQVLERENFLCQGCHYAKAVHVHHTTYDNLGDELLFQLVALCVQCHSKLHPEKSLQ